MESNYSKFKERSPQDTIFEIQRILNNLDLFGVLEWTPKAYDGARSNRVTLYPTPCGTNGKGTNELYAAASDHAELIERMQNNILVLRAIRPALKEACGFYYCPDEKAMTVEEILAQDSNFLNNMFDRYELNAFERAEFLRQISSKENEPIPVVNFANLEKNKIEWLPYHLIISVCGSNGMAAGNTFEEAMVQGLSEIFERFVNIAVLLGQYVLPKIPDEYLKPYSIWNLIEKIRAEALQGRNMEEFTAVNRVGSIEESDNDYNIPNIMKVSARIYPTKFFTDKPSCEFKEWDAWQSTLQTLNR